MPVCYKWVGLLAAVVSPEDSIHSAVFFFFFAYYYIYAKFSLGYSKDKKINMVPDFIEKHMGGLRKH